MVSTLWSVNDLSTALLMGEFYRRHLAEGEAVAKALRGAQLWLRRDVTAGELTERFAAEEATRLAAVAPAELAGDQFLRFAACDPDDRPFAHAYYWAAFTLSGL